MILGTDLLFVLESMILGGLVYDETTCQWFMNYGQNIVLYTVENESYFKLIYSWYDTD